MINAKNTENFTPYNLLALPVSDASKPYVLVADVAQDIIVPADAKLVMYSANGDFWAGEAVVAPAVPTITAPGFTKLEQNPDSRVITDGTTSIGLVAATGCIVQVAFYA